MLSTKSQLFRLLHWVTIAELLMLALGLLFAATAALVVLGFRVVGYVPMARVCAFFILPFFFLFAWLWKHWLDRRVESLRKKELNDTHAV